MDDAQMDDADACTLLKRNTRPFFFKSNHVELEIDNAPECALSHFRKVAAISVASDAASACNKNMRRMVH